MKTLYAACLARLGLSQPEAATLHGVRVDTVKSWASGRNAVPRGAWRDLRALEEKIIDRSEAVREAWEDAGEICDIEASAVDHAGRMALADFALSFDPDSDVVVTMR